MPRWGRAGPKQAGSYMVQEAEKSLGTLHRARGRAEFTSDVGDHVGPALGPRHSIAGERAVADGDAWWDLKPQMERHSTQGDIIDKWDKKMRLGLETKGPREGDDPKNKRKGSDNKDGQIGPCKREERRDEQKNGRKESETGMNRQRGKLYNSFHKFFLLTC
ncbi:hypothetical protein B0H11DRAFT_1935166 [Mycena galericulata]|nr:hypothetical protein B0H11DRAFT_1935166 [Mycena galericulata]